ncbi:MAG: HAD family phosphatase [Pseudomonadota bacterium]
MPVSYVLFDLGNVIVDWDPMHLYRRRFGDEAKARWFCDTICTMDWHKAHDAGVSMDETIPALVEQHPEHADHIRAWRDEWMGMFAGYEPGVPALMARLEERRVPLYGLSNVSHEVMDDIAEAFPLVKVLRDLVVSGAEGVIKPDPAIFEIALDRMGRPDPGEVLFIDDRRDNAEAAEGLGFQTHHFQGAPGLEASLKRHDLL